MTERLPGPQKFTLERCWMVRGAEAVKCFPYEDEAVAYAGEWGRVISMVEARPSEMQCEECGMLSDPKTTGTP